jgi:hypothetical protein
MRKKTSLISLALPAFVQYVVEADRIFECLGGRPRRCPSTGSWSAGHVGQRTLMADNPARADCTQSSWSSFMWPDCCMIVETRLEGAFLIAPLEVRYVRPDERPATLAPIGSCRSLPRPTPMDRPHLAGNGRDLHRCEIEQAAAGSAISSLFLHAGHFPISGQCFPHSLPRPHGLPSRPYLLMKVG